MTDEPRRWTFQLQITTTILLACVLTYVGAFVYYSRFSPKIVTSWGSDDYWFDDTIVVDGLVRHQRLCRIFWPLVELDARLLSGRHAQRPLSPGPIQLLHDVQPAP